MKQLTSLLRPRRKEDFVGNSQVLNLIEKNLSKNDFSHINIFYGQNGTGKSSMAEYVALSLACEGKQEGDYNPCCECEVCKSALNSNFESVKGIKKVDMALVEKKDVLNVLKEMFVFEGEADKNIFILEEMQALDKEQQKSFLEYLAKVPEDVYIFITTDKFGTGIIPPLKNRSVVLEVKNPNFKEALDFFEDVCYELGISVSSKKVAKQFVKACNNNPRSIVTNLELFKNLGEISEAGLNSLFDLKEDLAKQMWKNLFSTEIDLSSFLIWCKEIGEQQSLLKIYNSLKWVAVDNLIVKECTVDDPELSTVEKGEIRKIIDNVSLKTYESCLKILEEECRDDAHAMSVLTRCKINCSVKETKESERISNTKVNSLQGQSYASRYGKR